MMMHMRSALAVLALASASIILGCSGSSHPEAPPPNIVVSTTASSETVEAGGTVSLTATVGGDPHNEGVTWALNGPGTLSAFTSTSVTYNAPADPLATDTPVSIVAISKADSSKKSTAGITVLALDVSLSASDSVVQAGGSITVDAQLVSDPSGKGVTWSLTPASGAGTLSDATSTSVTYHAPASPPASDQPVTITGTSVADSSKTGELTITMLAIGVSLSISDQIVPAGTSATIEAQVVSDPSGGGVTWSLSPASGAGMLSDAPRTSVTYHAPAAAPASDVPVTITGTSVADTSKSGELTITVPQIRVSISPASTLIPVGSQQEFASTVSYDPKDASVTWALTQGGAPCSPICGTMVPINEVSTRYVAPATLPSDAKVSLTAISATDHNATASAAITLTAGTVKLAPDKLDFGRTGKSGKTMEITLTNTGSNALTGISMTLANPAATFSQTNDCGVSVAASGSCTISVKFRPERRSGSFTATLSISDSSPDSPQLVPLSGCVAGGCPAVAQSVLATTRIASVPPPTGPNAVGSRILDLIDTARDDPYLANGTRRELLVRLWYPASSGEACRSAEYASPPVWKYFSQLAGVPLPQVKTNSCQDARIADGAHPVVVFTHGFTGTFTDYSYLFEDLASRGYVVASVDHTYEATALSFPDGRFARSVLGSHLSDNARMDTKTLSLALAVRLGDLSFVLDQLEHLNRAVEGPLTNHLDLSSVAIAGHSFGGLTALEALEHERRFRTAISLDGVVPGSAFNSTDQGVLLLDAGRELWTDDELKLWDKLRGPRLAVNLKGAEHATPTDEVWLVRGAVMTGTMTPDRTIDAIRNYVAAFLDADLRGEPASRLLSKASADYSGVDVTLPTQSPCCRTY